MVRPGMRLTRRHRRSRSLRGAPKLDLFWMAWTYKWRRCVCCIENNYWISCISGEVQHYEHMSLVFSVSLMVIVPVCLHISTILFCASNPQRAVWGSRGVRCWAPQCGTQSKHTHTPHTPNTKPTKPNQKQPNQKQIIYTYIYILSFLCIVVSAFLFVRCAKHNPDRKIQRVDIRRAPMN